MFSNAVYRFWIKLINKVGGRVVEMTETIEVKNLPEEMTCIYEAPGNWVGAWNRVNNRFENLVKILGQIPVFSNIDLR